MSESLSGEERSPSAQQRHSAALSPTSPTAHAGQLRCPHRRCCWHQSLEGMAGLTPSATQPRGSSVQTLLRRPALSMRDGHARPCFLGKGPPDALGGLSGPAVSVCGVGPAGQSHEQPAGGGAVSGVGAGRGGKVGVGAGPSSGNAAHRHFVWPGWAEVRALDLNAKVCCSWADKGPIVCK